MKDEELEKEKQEVQKEKPEFEKKLEEMRAENAKMEKNIKEIKELKANAALDGKTDNVEKPKEEEPTEENIKKDLEKVGW